MTGETVLCLCPGFQLWYVGDDGANWCRCAHADDEHLDRRGSCTGELVWSRPAGEMPTWTCPHCGATSRQSEDVANHYCGACHHFCEDVPS